MSTISKTAETLKHPFEHMKHPLEHMKHPLKPLHHGSEEAAMCAHRHYVAPGEDKCEHGHPRDSNMTALPYPMWA